MEKRRGKFRILEFLLFVAAVYLGIMSIRSYVGGRYGNMPGDVTELRDGWYYIQDDERVDVKLPGRIGLPEGESLTLFYDVMDDRLSGRTMTTKGALYDLRVEVRCTDGTGAAALLRPVDTHMLFSYHDEAFERNVRMAEKLFCDVVLPLDIEGKVIALHFSGSETGRYEITPVYYGSSNEVFGFHYKEDALAILMVTAMFVLSIFSMAVSIYLRFTKMKDCRFMFAALFMLFCGIWCITDLSVVQLMTGLSPITNFVSFVAFMSMPIPMIYFIRTTGEMRRHRILEVCVKVFYLNLILQMVLNLMGFYQFIDMLFVTHLLLVSGVILMIVLMVRENRIRQSDELRIILKAFMIVGFGGILALVLYYTTPNIHYEIIYEGGILIFMIYLLSAVVRGVVDNMKFRGEITVMQRLSKVDNLTGLGNRSALDHFLVEFEEHADTCSNALMMILDINRLKEVNDRSGHGAGDEMIISAARCLKEAFGSSAHCFRTGGGEFYAVMVNPVEGEAVWNERLNQELNKYNQRSRNRLTLARGSSLLVENGVRKGISDWKYDAEQQLHRNKGWRRVERVGNHEIPMGKEGSYDL